MRVAGRGRGIPSGWRRVVTGRGRCITSGARMMMSGLTWIGMGVQVYVVYRYVH